MSPALNVLLVGIHAESVAGAFEAAPPEPCTVVTAADAGAALAAASAARFDAALVDADAVGDVKSLIRATAGQSAVLVLMLGAEPDIGEALEWTKLGAEDVLGLQDLSWPGLLRRIGAAVERKRLEIGSRKAYSTDLATGLPHQQQLVEHMSQLLALREREPSPMAVLVLRIEGFSTTESRLGPEAADALRRKIAVRLRASVRASDVVAAIDDSTYAVLLGALLAPADAERVGAKLVQVMMAPLSVGGAAVGVAVAVGIGQYPADGSQPDALLRKAIGMALDEPAQGRVGMANFQESGAQPLAAANDDEAPSA